METDSEVKRVRAMGLLKGFWERGLAMESGRNNLWVVLHPSLHRPNRILG